jgi:hypothetical protein
MSEKNLKIKKAKMLIDDSNQKTNEKHKCTNILNIKNLYMLEAGGAFLLMELMLASWLLQTYALRQGWLVFAT